MKVKWNPLATSCLVGVKDLNGDSLMVFGDYSKDAEVKGWKCKCCGHRLPNNYTPCPNKCEYNPAIDE